MDKLILVVKDWPVIVQGVIGSALFWLILLIGQHFSNFVSASYSRHSKQARLSWLTNRKAQLMGDASRSDAEFATYALILLYRASRHLFKGLMWLAMGLVFQSVFMPAGIIGFIGCLYYLLKGSEIVGPILSETGTPNELEAVKKEIIQLNNL